LVEPELVHWRGARYSVGAYRCPLLADVGRLQGWPGAGKTALHKDRDTGIGHPGKLREAQVVAAEMLVAELGDHFISVRRVAQHGCDANRLVLPETAGVASVA
jgi:hypothetical protein